MPICHHNGGFMPHFPPTVGFGFCSLGEAVGEGFGEGWPEQTEEVRGWLVLYSEGPFP